MNVKKIWDSEKMSIDELSRSNSSWSRKKIGKISEKHVEIVIWKMLCRVYVCAFFSSLHSVWPCYSRKTSHKFKHQFLLHLQSTLHISYVHLCWVLFWHTQKKRFVKPFFSYYFKFELLIEEFSELNFMVHSKQNDESEKKSWFCRVFFSCKKKASSD